MHAAFGRQLDGFVSAASRPERSAQAATVQIDSGGLGDGKPLQLIADVFRNRVQPTHGSDQFRVSTVLGMFAVCSNLFMRSPCTQTCRRTGRDARRLQLFAAKPNRQKQVRASREPIMLVLNLSYADCLK
jgi:hypothetical protein